MKKRARPPEQSQRYGARGFEARTGAYGSLQKQFENRYTSGGYSGLKTSGRALGGPPGAGSTPSKRNQLPRTGASASARATPAAQGAPADRRAPAARSAPPTRRAPSRRTAAARRVSVSAAGGTHSNVGSATARPSASRRPSPAASGSADVRITQAICQRLSQPVEDLELADLANERFDATDVRVTVAGGKVTLEGTVPERRMKPYIEALVDACPGVQDIENRLRVRR